MIYWQRWRVEKCNLISYHVYNAKTTLEAVCNHCHPAHSDKFWKVFQDVMSKKFFLYSSKNESVVKSMLDIQSIFKIESKSWKEYPHLNNLVQILDNFSSNMHKHEK